MASSEFSLPTDTLALQMCVRAIVEVLISHIIHVFITGSMFKYMYMYFLDVYSCHFLSRSLGRRVCSSYHLSSCLPSQSEQ